MTLSQVVATTQRILNYASYEAVHGSSPEFADLRSAENEVFELAELDVEPFEEGSFVIPAKLRERDIVVDKERQRTLSGVDVLDRFASAMDGISRGESHSVSIGMIQAVEDLGKITKREASIEYTAFGLQQPMSLVVDNSYVEKVVKTKLARRSTKTIPDTLDGVVTAVDIIRYTFALKVSPKVIVKGSYESMVADKLADSLGESVRIYGVVQYDHAGTPRHIRAFVLDSLDPANR
jgi:hypothetical protein